MTSSAIDEKFLTQTLIDLVQIDSRNPSLTPDGPGEAAAGEYIAHKLTELGLDVITHELEPNRVNVVGILKGIGGGRSLLLNGHLDTVGVKGLEEPFSSAIRDGRLYGRGSQDMKGSLAAMMAAVRRILETHTPQPLPESVQDEMTKIVARAEERVTGREGF